MASGNCDGVQGFPASDSGLGGGARGLDQIKLVKVHRSGGPSTRVVPATMLAGPNGSVPRPRWSSQRVDRHRGCPILTNNGPALSLSMSRCLGLGHPVASVVVEGPSWMSWAAALDR